MDLSKVKKELKPNNLWLNILSFFMLLGAFVGVVVLLFIGFWVVRWLITADTYVNHYNDDFSRYCIQQKGHPIIGDRDICYKNNKIIMHESPN